MRLNNIVIAGNLTKDPELRYTPNGVAISNFSIAVNENEDKVSFFNVKAFKNTAELINKHLTKGSGVVIVGKLAQNRWQDKDGNNRSVVEIIALNVQFIPKGQARKEEPAEELDLG